MNQAMNELWHLVRGARTFESAVDVLARALAPELSPMPLRAVAVLRAGAEIRAIHTVPLADPRAVDGTAACAAWRSIRDDGAPFTLLVPSSPSRSSSPDTGRDALRASHETREGLLERNTRQLLVCPLFGSRGMLVFEFDDAPDSWRPAAECACMLSAWLPHYEERVAPGPHVDRYLPVAGPNLSRVLHLLERFARQDEPILLYGESGVGKTRLVSWLHARSHRAGGPVESVNLLTVEENLRAARLFGTRRGAFTGAVDMFGAVARARGGTLFVDEIDKLPLASQAQLLQLLDDGTFQPLGAPAVEHADLRVVTGTNADLAARVREGAFLHDLHHRIAVLPLRVPPLRERPEDIVPWATWFLGEHARRTGVERSLSGDAAARLAAFPWPGNLRQLAAVVSRVVALASDDPGAPIEAGAVDRALALDPESAPPLLDAMRAAARAFVQLAETRGDLRLEHLRALRGMALEVAVERHGKRDALRVLQEAKRLEGDNHHRFLRDEAEHVDVLRQLLGQARRDSSE